MRAEIRVAQVDKGSCCYLCKEPGAIVATPRDTDDPEIDMERDSWYPMGLISCWACVRKVLTMLIADPKLPEHEADSREDEDMLSTKRLDSLESVIDEIGEELEK